MSSINSLLDKIIALEKAIKKKYPKQAGKVRIINAKQTTDYSFKDPESINQMEWANKYHDVLAEML